MFIENCDDCGVSLADIPVFVCGKKAIVCGPCLLNATRAISYRPDLDTTIRIPFEGRTIREIYNYLLKALNVVILHVTDIKFCEETMEFYLGFTLGQTS